MWNILKKEMKYRYSKSRVSRPSLGSREIYVLRRYGAYYLSTGDGNLMTWRNFFFGFLYFFDKRNKMVMLDWLRDKHYEIVSRTLS